MNAYRQRPVCCGGVEDDRRDSPGSTSPLVEMPCSNKISAECVEMLIKHGASTSAKNAAGKSALELATLDAVRQAVEAGAEKGAKRTGSSRRKQTRGKGGRKSARAATAPR